MTSEPHPELSHAQQSHLKENLKLPGIFLNMMENSVPGGIPPEPILVDGRPTPLVGYIYREEVVNAAGQQEVPQEFVTREGKLVRGPVRGAHPAFAEANIAANDLAKRLGAAISRYIEQNPGA